MARNMSLEELLSENLAGTPGLTQKAMFGGTAWLVNGNLLCGASDAGMLVRLGKDNDAWALKIPGIALMVMQGPQDERMGEDRSQCLWRRRAAAEAIESCARL